MNRTKNKVKKISMIRNARNIAMKNMTKNTKRRRMEGKNTETP